MQEASCIMLEPALIARIRDIFLHQASHVSVAAAAGLLGWSPGRMNGAIASGEVDLLMEAGHQWIAREELMAKALESWSAEMIEEALGADAASILPEGRRLDDLHAPLPRYQIAMLRYFAQLRQTTVGDILARELEDVASANAAELSAALPGFAEALDWPEGEAAALPG
jgi:hypothetical protein